MKKSYSAPDIVFESFSLSTSIAACDIETNFNAGTCGYEVYPEFVIFKYGIVGCGVPIEGDIFSNVNGDTLCYDNPSGLTNLFSS